MCTENNYASCGFLASRSYSTRQASTFFEMRSQTRKEGGGWWAMQTAGMGSQSVPACCVGAFPILDEIKALEPEALKWRHKSIGELTKEELDTHRDDRFDSTTPERNEAAKAVFNKLRPECHKWFPYTPGFSPGQHMEAFQMQQLEQDRRAFELKLFNMNKKVTTNSNRVMIVLAICAIIFAAAEVYFAVAVINPEHWLFNWLR